jgi:hypothetical protein
MLKEAVVEAKRTCKESLDEEVVSSISMVAWSSGATSEDPMPSGAVTLFFLL